MLLDFGDRFTVSEKGPSDLVTDADLASQEAIRDVVAQHFPADEFIGEESSVTSSRLHETCWIVDPLDGTTNYVHRVPHYAVSVALVERGRPNAGCIFDPVARECYTASLGGGAFLNGERLKASSVTDLKEALVAASFSSHVDANSREIDQFVDALLVCQAVRRTGSAALNLCYVASGRFDAFWAMTTKAWDIAAGVLLVEEAGGTVTHWTGKALDLAEPHPAAAGTSALHEAFRRLLVDARRRT